MEKTFEELIRTHEKIERMKGYISCQDAEKILQQVREATKAEVLTLCDDNFFSKEPKGKLMENIENLPTDRIKLTDENRKGD